MQTDEPVAALRTCKLQPPAFARHTWLALTVLHQSQETQHLTDGRQLVLPIRLITFTNLPLKSLS